jgi:hypothetical protein
MRTNTTLPPLLATSASMLLAAALHAHAADFEARGLPVGGDGVITRANLDASEDWPLTIERGTFVCDGDAVFVSDGATQYPLNGVAKTLAKTHPRNRRPLEDIWRRDEDAMQSAKRGAPAMDMVRVNITPVLERGVAWCRQQQLP